MQTGEDHEHARPGMNVLAVAVFVGAMLTLWVFMHCYVLWRLTTIPWVTAHCSTGALLLAAALLWLSYPAGRILNACNLETVGVPLEFAGAIWMGILFLAIAALLVVDVVTLGGLVFPELALRLRGGALLVAAALSLISLAQGLRPPVVRDYEVRLAGLPPERDGLTLVAVSDLHLGTLTGERWLTKLVRQVNDLKPDLLAIVGDLVDKNVHHVETFLPLLKQLRAPLGVWAVTGNHEFYAGLEPSAKLLEAAGYHLLRDRWAEAAPGLALAGVDDLTARRQLGQSDDTVRKTMNNRPVGATILLSHSPLQTDAAAIAGVNLMLSGHTHAGQLWPFNFLVRLRYKLLAGRHEIGGMTLIVCRGTGTWGPPMRLWRRSEILRIRLVSDQ